MAQNDVPPEVCFGKHWDASEVKCAGGLDPTYINKLDNTHRRDRCKWYQSCASRTTTSKLGAAAQHQVPVQPQQQPMFRPPVPMPAQPPAWQRPLQSIANGVMQGATTALAGSDPSRVPVRVFGQPPYQQAQPQQYPQQYPQYYHPQYQQGSMAPPWAAMMPQMVPMNYQAAGAQMPAYLTVPEPVVPGVHWGYRLGYSVLRSMLKASGHTLSNFFDFTPIHPWPTPPPGTNMP